ncbi:ArnT family glycosyltransferase [Sungkyunkwania multivorans]|uniref:ArnT family glycosyltransferase n=1 Tax=Sungkyunkwania multivorans TaxID=1173618 RepID=A0ABW3CVT8_9FLAO
MEVILQRRDYLTLYILLAVIYLLGLQIPLMENDSAQHATMAMRMYLEDDFLNIYKGGKDYLDKPHLHFWLAAFSFKLFGIGQWSYRLPALLFTILAAYSSFRLAHHLYGKKAGHITSLVFLSAQAIILANHDVRTDAVLTGAVAFGVWQLVRYIDTQKLLPAIFGAVGVGLAFSTKGQLGVFIPGACVLCYLLYGRKWKSVFSWKVLIGSFFFLLTITPVVYAFYVQFDLHPEKIIEGQKNISGVRFILWDQSFNRLTASGFQQNSPDYFFFFHTLLWAFLPWSIIAYSALFVRLKQLFKIRFAYQKGMEFLTVGGIILVMVVISFSKFKLPHYLNSLLPIFAILVAGFLVFLHENGKTKFIRTLLIIQYATLSLGTVFVLFLTFWAFGVPSAMAIVSIVFLLIGFIYLQKVPMSMTRRMIMISVYFMVLINFCLNTQFYPNLLHFQAGNNAAMIIKEAKIDKDRVFKIDRWRASWSLDFYLKQEIAKVKIEEVTKTLKSGDWLLAYDEELELLEQKGLNWDREHAMDHYRITRLKLSFLNPETRPEQVGKAYLLRIVE